MDTIHAPRRTYRRQTKKLKYINTSQVIDQACSRKGKARPSGLASDAAGQRIRLSGRAKRASSPGTAWCTTARAAHRAKPTRVASTISG